MAASKTNSSAQREQQQVADLDTIAPVEASVTVDGVACRVKRLRMRELMAVARLLTAGLGDRIGDIKWESEDEAFGQQLLGLAIVGLPDAEDEACELFSKIVEPQDPRHTEQVRTALDNPELDTSIDIITAVIEQERESFGLLLGKLRTLLGGAQALTRKQQSS